MPVCHEGTDGANGPQGPVKEFAPLSPSGYPEIGIDSHVLRS
jgi:hypothetical protein